MHRLTAKLVSALLLSILLMLSVACGEAPRDTDSAIAWTLQADGGELELILAANATTGYEWTYEMSPADALEELEATYRTASDGAQTPLAGAGGQAIFRFAAAKQGGGTVTLTLQCARAWEDEPIRVYELDIRVDDAGLLHVEAARLFELESTSE